MSIKTVDDIKKFQKKCLNEKAIEDFESIKSRIIEEAEKCKDDLDLDFELYEDLKEVLEYEGYGVYYGSKITWGTRSGRSDGHARIAYDIYMKKMHEYELEEYKKIEDIVLFIESSIKNDPLIKYVKFKNLNEEQINLLDDFGFKVAKDEYSCEFKITWT